MKAEWTNKDVLAQNETTGQSKSILVIDMPESYMGSVIDVKLYGKEKVVHEHYVNKLKPLPQKIEMDLNEYYEGVANGWNDCIDAITGETE